MIIFWIGVVFLLVLALGWLLPGLWRPKAAAPASAGANAAVYSDQLREAERDLAADLITPERFEQLRAEIQRRVLEDTAAAAPAVSSTPARRTAIVLALLLPLASVATYLALGQPQATQALAAADAGRHEVGADEIEAMVAKLADRLRAEPANPDGWRMLARSYAALGRYTDAVAAQRKVVELQADDADALADLADVVGMAQGGKLAGEPAQLVQRALGLNPQHPKSLALAGTLAFDAGEYRLARDLWQRLRAQLPDDSELARTVQGSIDEAASRLAAVGGAAVHAAPAAPAAPASAAAEARLTGEVMLGPELASRVAAGDTVFVFARAADGPRLPLAIVRQPVGGWPLRFTLDDSSAMTPQSRLSGAPSVVVVARISKSGNASPQPGDLYGESAPTTPRAQGLRIVIDRVQP